MRRCQILMSLLVLLLLGCSSASHVAKNQSQWVVLYDNDVHCSVDGYATMSALRHKFEQEGKEVLVVSSGDFLSGAVLGSVSYGDYIVRIMNAVGYDYVTLGNHEFDFTMPRLFRNMHNLGAQVVCCNFRSTVADSSVYPAFAIKQIGSIKVAFLGITTPSAMSSSSASYFQNKEGEFVYTFVSDSLSQLVQRQVDLARSQGADYVVALAHLGDMDTPKLAEATSGIDVIIDGHSHSMIAHKILRNNVGKEVVWTSTGSAFKNIGVLEMDDKGGFETSLFTTDSLNIVDSITLDTINLFKQSYAQYAERHLGECQVDLMANKGHNNRPVRRQETNLGDFCASAMREVTGADIAILNGGSIRANLSAGNVSFNDLYAIFPFNNQMCVASVEGWDILNALEMGARSCPDDEGGFLQVSGLCYEIDTTIVSSVQVDEHGLFKGVTGQRRAGNVRVLNAKGEYEPLNPEQRYTVASSEYVLKACGDGLSFPSLKVVKEGICTDAKVLELYLVEHLNGIIGEQYSVPQNRIIIK